MNRIERVVKMRAASMTWTSGGHWQLSGLWAMTPHRRERTTKQHISGSVQYPYQKLIMLTCISIGYNKRIMMTATSSPLIITVIRYLSWGWELRHDNTLWELLTIWPKLDWLGIQSHTCLSTVNSKGMNDYHNIEGFAVLGSSVWF